MTGLRAIWSLLLGLSLGLSKSQSYKLELWSNHDILPFNASTLIPSLEGATDYPPIGPCKLVQVRDKKPRYFPIEFNIWTREGGIRGISTQVLEHTVHLADKEEPQVRSYEFNLTALVAPLNTWSPHRRTVIIVPGYRTKVQVDWIDDIRELWLQLEDVNVIEVYWPRGNSDSYGLAVASTKIVARQITMLLYYLAELHGIDFNSADFGASLHFVGHSLGAHIAGFVSQEMGGRAGRITGLDPAGPFFDDIDQRLDRSDALFVDAIHTNVGKMNLERLYLMIIMNPVKRAFSWLNPFAWYNNPAKGLAERYERKPSDTIWFGLPGPVGHLDYYANGGSMQPGCDDDLHICDHHRASLLYIDLLRYEQSTRKVYGADIVMSPLAKRLRMIALPSPNLEQFESTQTLARDCPLLQTQQDDQQQPLGGRQDEFRRCAVPMDMLATGPQLKEELERDYSDQPEVNRKRSRRVHFLTNNKDPYVGEQHLMQLHLAPQKPALWSKGCKLTALIRSRTDAERVSLVNYDLDSLDPLVTDTSDSLILPFASPVDWRLYHPTPQTFAKLLNQTNTQLKSSTQPSTSLLEIENYLPGEVSIEVTHADGELKEAKCQLHIDLIETRPFTSVNYNIGVWYGQGGRSGLPALSGTQVSLDLVIDNTRKYETVQPVFVNFHE